MQILNIMKEEPQCDTALRELKTVKDINELCDLKLQKNLKNIAI